MRTIRVYIVDDSSLTRRILRHVLERDPEIEIVGSASNGRIALEEIPGINPDVVTLDIEMPVMNGLETLSLLMASTPKPVVMVSSYSTQGADLTFRALDMGAVDFISKPHPVFPGSIEDIEDEITQKVKHASTIRVNKTDSGALNREIDLPVSLKKEGRRKTNPYKNLIAIGVSTGGPQSLRRILPRIPRDIDAGILIVQHMPPGYTKALADRLNAISDIEVAEAENGSPLLNGSAWIARGDYHLSVSAGDSGLKTRLSREEKVSRFRPSIDVLMSSVSGRFHDRAIGVLMTGMGSDGIDGVKSIREKHGRVVAQDEATSVVFGMNKIAIERGLADRIAALDQIVPTLLEWTH